MDFYNPEDLARFFEMDAEERKEAVHDWLATVAEPWQGDSDADILARSIVGSMSGLLNASEQIDDFKKVNRHIMGLWMHTFMHISRGFQTLAALSDIKKGFENDGA